MKRRGEIIDHPENAGRSTVRYQPNGPCLEPSRDRLTNIEPFTYHKSVLMFVRVTPAIRKDHMLLQPAWQGYLENIG